MTVNDLTTKEQDLWNDWKCFDCSTQCNTEKDLQTIDSDGFCIPQCQECADENN